MLTFKEHQRIARIQDRVLVLRSRITAAKVKKLDQEKAELAALEWAITKIKMMDEQLDYLHPQSTF